MGPEVDDHPVVVGPVTEPVGNDSGDKLSFIQRIPGAIGQPNQEFTPGGHFLQDDRGEDVAAALVAWLA